MPQHSKSMYQYHDAYANLAAAIIRSGELQHDVEFLHSNWCELLKEICRLDDIMYGGRNIDARGRSIVSINKGGHNIEFD